MAGAGENDFVCEARLFADGRTWCGRCDSVVDDPGRLRCKPAAECGLTVTAIVEALEDEAMRIDGSNEAAARLAEAKIREGLKVVPGPYRDRLRRAAAMRAAVRAIQHFAGKKA